ncbi:MAG: flavin oxidoreductase [Oscillatoriales cyanobacterium RM1_1_9]|nr:flavin oxidoreductase [Oscillatoriales cyanobacterium SM2_3_0]NJO47671.1 flavin oxidoreductase [Oscillatoriales cyanobacterium RM2_1_1]NJO71166.1 flavin oxidoreductase [Oscillatoriales cyanobacterium RM1_1_9]
MAVNQKERGIALSVKPRDVQNFWVGQDTKVLRSRTWDRLKFEVEYSLQRGTTANSYIIEADKIALIDPPGESFTENYLQAVGSRLNWDQVNYIILGHFNANRGATLKAILAKAPDIQWVCSNPAALALREYFQAEMAEADFNLNILTVKGEETLNLGQGHDLRFITTPTPRWPDGLLTYDTLTRILFSDKFFGAHVCGDQVFDEGWKVYSEDRQFYYDCLHAAQAQQVLTTLEKVANFPEVQFYAPNHGPMVRYGKAELTHLYRQWSQKQKSQELRVALLYASAYGNTATVAQAIARGLTKSGVAVESINCEHASATEIQAAIENCDGFIIGSPTLGGHAPTQIQAALGIILNTASTQKLAGVFGSFGWSGEAIDLLAGKLKDAGFKFGFEPIRVKFKPTDITIQTCKEAAIDFAQALKRSQKRRAIRPVSATSSGADRTAQAVGRLVGSLCVMSCRRGDVESAMLASWVSQATFNPPGLTVSVAKDRALESLTYTGDPFVLNILEEGKSLRKHFTKQFEPGEDRFAGMETEIAKNGCVVLKQAVAYLECSISQRMECGDHWVIYATVTNGSVLNPEGTTAVHYRKTGTYY